MTSNLTRQGIVMENFNILQNLNGDNTEKHIPKAQQKVSGGINAYAPGSPKPARDFDLAHKLAPDSSDCPGCKLLTHQYDMKGGQNGAPEIHLDDQVKDAEIKRLTRSLTFLQAKIRQTDERFDIVAQERDRTMDELRKMNQHFMTISQDREHLIATNKYLTEEILRLRQNVNQSCEKADSSLQVDSNDMDILYKENQRLKLENNHLKKTHDSLASECSALRESLKTSSSSSENCSMPSSQVCSKELENLHRMVDTLKSTALKQRDFLVKLKLLPQVQTNGALESKNSKKAESNRLTNSSPHLRQGEESTEVRDEFNSGQHLGLVGDQAIDVSHDIQKNLEIPQNKSNQDLVMRQQPLFDAGMSQFDLTPVAQGHICVLGEDTFDSPLNNGMDNNDALYMNAIDLGPHFDINHKEISSKREPSLSNHSSGGQIKPHMSGKKTLSEVIRRPSQNLPLKSKTEILGYNPKRRSPSDSCLHEPPTQANIPARHQTAPQRQWQESSYSTTSTTGIATDMNQQSGHATVQPSQYYATWNIDPPRHHDSPELSPSNYRLAASNASQDDLVSTSNSPAQRQNTDTLCPVCHKDFGSVSIETFQSHVLDCFDSENGPETMVAEDSGPQRICPMCNTSFGDNMPQHEFEKHVNSHFDDFGENFEVLDP